MPILLLPNPDTESEYGQQRLSELLKVLQSFLHGQIVRLQCALVELISSDPGMRKAV